MEKLLIVFANPHLYIFLPLPQKLPLFYIASPSKMTTEQLVILNFHTQIFILGV